MATIPTETLYTSKPLGFGRIAEHNPLTNIRSKAAENNLVKFGRAVREGTDAETQVDIYNSATGTFKGVAGYSTSAKNIDNSLFNDGDSVPLVDQGIVTVEQDEAIVIGDPVRIRFDGANAGVFHKTSIGGSTVRITAGAEWRESKASGVATKLFLSPPFTISAD